MKIKLKRYSKEFVKRFQKERKTLSKLGEFEIHHIGSTSVPGIMGKGWIDILIIAKNKKQRDSLIKKLEKIGYKKAKTQRKERIFFSKIKSGQRYNLHLYLRNKKAINKILFRDYLIKHPEEAKKYEKLKKDILKKSKGDRVKYKELKENYFKALNIKIFKPAEFT